MSTEHLIEIEVATGHTVKDAKTLKWVGPGGKAFVPPGQLEAKPGLAHMPTPSAAKPMTMAERMDAAAELLAGLSASQVQKLADDAKAAAPDDKTTKGKGKGDDTKPPDDKTTKDKG